MGVGGAMERQAEGVGGSGRGGGHWTSTTENALHEPRPLLFLPRTRPNYTKSMPTFLTLLFEKREVAGRNVVCGPRHEMFSIPAPVEEGTRGQVGSDWSDQRAHETEGVAGQLDTVSGDGWMKVEGAIPYAVSAGTN